MVGAQYFPDFCEVRAIRPPPAASLAGARSENRRSRWSHAFRAKLRGALFATPPNSGGSAKAPAGRRQGAPPPWGASEIVFAV